MTATPKAKRNRQQTNYLRAKSKVRAIDKLQAESERAFMRDNGYYNSDGSIPEVMYMYDNDDKFDQCCEEFEMSGYSHFDELRQAQAELIRAENALIDYALSIMPAYASHYRDVLDRQRNNPKVRQKMLDLAMRLDVSTVPKRGRVTA